MNKAIKSILIGFVIFIMSLLTIQNNVYADEDEEDSDPYGVACTGLDLELCTIYTSVANGSEDKIIEKLSSYYNYTSSELYTKFTVGFKSDTVNKELYIYVTEKNGSKYKIKIGEEPTEDTENTFILAERSFTYSDLCSTFACPLEENEIEAGTTSWEVVLVISTDKNPDTEWHLTTGSRYKVIFYINEAYSGDYLEGDDTGYNREFTFEHVEINTVVSRVLDFVEWIDDTITTVVDGVADIYHWITKFCENAVGTIITLFLDGLMGIYGDGPQLMINYVQTVIDGTSKDDTMLYSYGNLYSDAQGDASGQYPYAMGKRDKYTHVQEGSDSTADVDINDTDDNYMFEDNYIPIITVDIYTMATNKVSLLDVNFLTEDTAGGESSIWLSLRRMVCRVIRSSIYIAAIILITTLIWYGVKVVANSMNPRKKAEDKEALNKFITAVTMLVGSIVIMAIGIYAYQAVDIDGSSSSDPDDSGYWEFPIRVSVNISEKEWFGSRMVEQIYSFSTTITGYIRFMAQIENPDRCMEKAGYVIAYIILANMNLIIFIIMLVRMIAMWILAIIGPILAALYAVTKDEKMIDRFKTWAYCYLILGFVQLFFAIAYWIMMETMGFN